ncbi:MAG: hypothetical protein JJ908_11680 [Rhizobiales bacterium]|nr:hypothetical protein [Hyphomicrobiales bacterium]MBO6699484.1 hypothetical protein [Hyphomicrobiales bacterium]MBO6737022.1 hypothetical protein [Hyphomicrobiales bacterium]MBO6911904.1 hypothetical protein [Hyphomicrobiales bacterium]MBO6954840.1 hypothetical protein [Hyphomicrobiales bacterium]
MSMRMRSKERVSEQDAKKWAWRWSIGLVLIIGLFPLVGAFFGELIARALGCVIDFPQLGACARPNAFLESFAQSLMGMIRWALISVPMAIVTLVGLAITYVITKKRSENA